MLEGLRVLELATYLFAPTAGAVLADWGADVVKVEHPLTGDPLRGVMSSGILPGMTQGINYLVEQPNRGKKGMGIDLSNPAGRELLYRLAERSDVFVTNFLGEARQRLEVDVEHIRARNPNIIYARASGYGERGPDAQTRGYDYACFAARTGLTYMTTPNGAMPVLQRPAVGDVLAGLVMAGGIAAAVAKRERTGEPSVVDLSLLGLGLWTLQLDIVLAGLLGSEVPRHNLDAMPNPLVNAYETAGERHIMLAVMEDQHWPDLCHRLGHPELVDDPRFKTAALRGENTRDCIRELRDIFRARPLEEWRRRLEGFAGVWSVIQTPLETHEDDQVLANAHLAEVTPEGTPPFKLVASPIQYDEGPVPLTRAPEVGEHTEEILLELGFSWEEIAALKDREAIV